MDTEDARLIRQYRKGDVESLTALVEKYRRPLYGFILNMTEGQADADEIFQDTWFRAIRGLPRYRQKNFMGWLVRIARNLIVDSHRRRRPAVSLDAPYNEDDMPLVDPVDPSPNPNEQAATNDDVNAVQHAVDALPPEQKEVFIMRMQAEMSFKDIAKTQGVSINTTLARMRYAVEKLRPVLQSEYNAMRDRS